MVRLTFLDVHSDLPGTGTPASLCPGSWEWGRLLMNSIQAWQLVAGEQTFELHLPHHLLLCRTWIFYPMWWDLFSISTVELEFSFSNGWTNSDKNCRREGSNAFFCLSCPLPNIYQTPAAYQVLGRLLLCPFYK